ncbi:MAG: perosamine synthetase [Solirubrobacteraceae bacterium]|nr:perosamine synthetase [Solirubrobacteraceae bacterium]
MSVDAFRLRSARAHAPAERHTGSGRLTVLPPVAPSALLRAASETLPFPLGEAGCTLFDDARRALWEGIAALGLIEDDVVLVPALHRGPEVEILRLAGLQIRLYAGTPALEPDAQELEALLEPRTRALYLIHQLGFAQDAERWRAWCAERNLLLLEDATQAWTASIEFRPVGSFGALAVFSLSQSFGLPDGGALLVDQPAGDAQAQERFGLGGLARCHGRWFTQRSHALERIAVVTRPYRSPAEDEWSPSCVGTGPAPATLRLLSRVADVHAAARRRAHYSLLLEQLGDHVAAPFHRLPEQAAPFGFPVIDREDRLRDRLRSRGIEAVRPWRDLHPDLGGDRFADAADRRRHTLLLPVHQELRCEDVERIAAAVRGSPVRRRTLRRPIGGGALPAAVADLRLEPIDSLDAPLPGWDALALEARSIFATHEWISTWWRHFGAGRSLHLVACRAPDDRLVAILPLYVQRQAGLRIVRFLGHGAADECGPICAPADRCAVARALRRAIDLLGADVLLVEQVPATFGWDALIGARILRREGSPIVRFHTSSWQELVATWGSNMKKQVGGRLVRKLQREHGLIFRETASAEKLASDIETLLDLHAARWDEQTPAFSDRADFHREFAALALRRGWLRLLFLELDGQPAAVLYNFRFADAEVYYQSGRDPAWSKVSLGLLVIAEAIRRAQQAGFAEFRFGRGGENYKYRFANADPGLQTIAIGRSRLGSFVLAGTAAVPEQAVKRLRRWSES